MSDQPARDYRSTVFLPRTEFPMKAGLPVAEPARLARWAAADLYGQLRAQRAGREKFILHDGPPYANGDIHIGHALNHILKDLVVRTQSMLGKDAPYVPGWDCHGLPIEWKVEEQYRAAKRSKDDVPPAEFRAECRTYARHWVGRQREQLKRLGVGGDWDHPYLTMDYDAEAVIVAELLKFAASGQLYRGAKPVMWSPVEKTALAEAEVEYADIVSTQIDVTFEIVESAVPELVGAYAVIWTTTPWTIPVNQAIAYGAAVAYELIGTSDGNKYLIAFDLTESFLIRSGLSLIDEPVMPDDAAGLLEWKMARSYVGSDLAGTIARHPMHHLGGFFALPRPFLAGDHVTTEQGTGLVHMAPDYGEEDFLVCQANGIGPVFAVEDDGRYRADWGWLGGNPLSVIDKKLNASGNASNLAEGPICRDLREAGALIAASDDYSHSYPHSWRSHAKLIYRATPQWFIPMDVPVPSLPALPSPLEGEGQVTPLRDQGEGAGGAETFRSALSLVAEGATGPSPSRGEGSNSPTLRETALAAIADTRWIPPRGQNRITAMVAGRPDWVISRQRAWGVPITLFVDRRSGEYLRDAAVNARIVAAIKAGGADAWWAADPAEFLGPGRDPADYERIDDILDVWFDSGCTHAFVLESGKWPALSRPAGYDGPPADLYLEGSDQHRGWFQSSLLESCGTRGRAPYKAVMTHGMTLDSRGFKQSKSLGNTTDPIKLMETYGADIVRLWAATVDATEDHRIGDEVLKGVADQYRKLRNTFRYLLGALDGWDEAERVADIAAMPELERWVLHRVAEIDAGLRAAVGDFDFNACVTLVSTFVNNDLSAFYFDIRKDSLYCDAPSSMKRRACRTVLDTLFHALVRWLAPVLVFTAEEVWLTRFPDAGSVHLEEWADYSGWRDDGLAARWERLRELRRAATEAIEPRRKEKQIGSSLEAELTLFDLQPGDDAMLASIDFAELCIAAKASPGSSRPSGNGVSTAYGASIGWNIEATMLPKCERCRRHLPDVVEETALCTRCTEVVDAG